MISWQQLESDRLLCKHEGILHRKYMNENKHQFCKELCKNREQEGWTNYDPIDYKDTKSKKEPEIDNRDENLFRSQTYLNSNDYLCHVYDLIKEKKQKKCTNM